jgi:hypothetical protein
MPNTWLVKTSISDGTLITPTRRKQEMNAIYSANSLPIELLEVYLDFASDHKYRLEVFADHEDPDVRLGGRILQGHERQKIEILKYYINLAFACIGRLGCFPPEVTPTGVLEAICDHIAMSFQLVHNSSEE